MVRENFNCEGFGRWRAGYFFPYLLAFGRHRWVAKVPSILVAAEVSKA